jgi:hypothetical protein
VIAMTTVLTEQHRLPCGAVGPADGLVHLHAPARFWRWRDDEQQVVDPTPGRSWWRASGNGADLGDGGDGRDDGQGDPVPTTVPIGTLIATTEPNAMSR